MSLAGLRGPSWGLLLLALLGAQACLPPTPGVYRHQRALSGRPWYPPFSAAEYARFEGAGSGRIAGRLEELCVDGSRRPVPDSLVVLDPVTSYSRVWWRCRGTSNNYLLQDPPPEPRVAAYRRSARTDGEGHFEFDRLPPGPYYVLSTPPYELCPTGSAAAGKAGAEVLVEAAGPTAVTLSADPAWYEKWSQEGCDAAPCPPCSYWRWLTRGCPCN